jgi:hypothetical protein
MNQDFAFEITPARARKLLKIAEVFMTEIDISLEPLSKIDIVPFNGTPEEQELYQFIIDTDYRCVVTCMSHDFERHTLLEMLRGREFFIVGDFHDWKDFGVEAVWPDEAMDHDFQKGKRHKVMIYDWAETENAANAEMLCMEFPKSIIYVSEDVINTKRQLSFQGLDRQQKASFTKTKQHNNEPRKPVEKIKDTNFPWWEMGGALFPNMPRSVFDLSNTAFLKRMKPIWKKNDVNDLAVVYNVFISDKMNNYGK